MNTIPNKNGDLLNIRRNTFNNSKSFRDFTNYDRKMNVSKIKINMMQEYFK